jgi:hypothetical protein
VEAEMAEPESELVPISTPAEMALDIAAGVSSIAPWVGGPVAQVLNGMSLGRKLERVRTVLMDMASRVKGLEDKAAVEYVKSDEFSELLERTLRQAADERNEEKRRAYAAFLAGSIASPGGSYDEKIRILRTLDEIQPDHIRMLHAMLQPPQPSTSTIGSLSGTLQRRLPGIGGNIAELAQQLTDMRLGTLDHLNTMMTPDGAEYLEAYLTPYGKRFIAYIMYGDQAAITAA